MTLVEKIDTLRHSMNIEELSEIERAVGRILESQGETAILVSELQGAVALVEEAHRQ